MQRKMQPSDLYSDGKMSQSKIFFSACVGDLGVRVCVFLLLIEYETPEA